jgi:hypothetical protein
VVGEVGALHLGPGALEQILAVPAVAADEHRPRDVLLLRLLGDGHHVVVVDGREDDVRLGGHDLIEVRPEVLFPLLEALVRHDLEVQLLRRVAEGLGQPGGIRILRRVEDGDLLLVELLGDELRRGDPLGVVGEAHAKDVLAPLGHLHVGRRGRDHRHLAGVGDEAAGQRAGRGHLAQQRHDLVPVDELPHLLRRLARVRLVVLVQHLDLAALDAPRGVHLVRRQVDTLLAILAELGLLPGEAQVRAHQDVAAVRLHHGPRVLLLDVVLLAAPRRGREASEGKTDPSASSQHGNNSQQSGPRRQP